MTNLSSKHILGQAIARQVKHNQVLGLGTGSTAEEAIEAIGFRLKGEGIRVFGVATSNRCEELAKNVGIEIIQSGEKPINWGFDGADEVEKETFNLLKGGWGSMTREKSVAKKCPRWIVIVDQSKLVSQLGEKFPIPVEVKEDQMHRVIENLYERYQPVDIVIRQKKDGTGEFRTDFGNPVIDVKVAPGSIKNEWEKEWEMIPGVVGTGLFLGGYPDEVWVARGEGIEKVSGLGKRNL